MAPSSATSSSSDYEERFGDRDVEGEIVARRILTIEGGVLRRVASPQGVWARGAHGEWARTDLPTHELAGGQEMIVGTKRDAAFVAKLRIADSPRHRIAVEYAGENCDLIARLDLNRLRY